MKIKNNILLEYYNYLLKTINNNAKNIKFLFII